MKHIGDVTKINGADIEPVDIITFGSPCTRLSVAGRHDGFDITFKCEGSKDNPHDIYKKTIRATDKYQYIYNDTCLICGKEITETNESALFFHAIRIINEMGEATNGRYPRFAVWENVPGAFSSNKGEDFRAVLEEIAEAEIPMPASDKWAEAGMVRTERVDIAWRVLDAQYWGVPQRRKRIFLVADFRGQRAGEILFVEPRLSWNLAESGEAGQEAAATVGDGVEGTIFAIAFGGARKQNVSSPLMANEGPNRHQGFSNTQFDAVCIRMREGSDGGGKGPLIEPQLYDMTHAEEVIRPVRKGIAPILNSRMGTGGNQVPIHLDRAAFNQGKNALYDFRVTDDNISSSLVARGPSSVAIPPHYAVRRLTPLECERLMGFPDGWTDIPGASDTARYKALGNSIAVPCLDYIFENMSELLKEGTK